MGHSSSELAKVTKGTFTGYFEGASASFYTSRNYPFVFVKCPAAGHAAISFSTWLLECSVVFTRYAISGTSTGVRDKSLATAPAHFLPWSVPVVLSVRATGLEGVVDGGRGRDEARGFHLTVVSSEDRGRLFGMRFAEASTVITIVDILIIFATTVCSVVTFAPIEAFVPKCPSTRSGETTVRGTVEVSSLRGMVCH